MICRLLFVLLITFSALSLPVFAQSQEPLSSPDELPETQEYQPEMSEPPQLETAETAVNEYGENDVSGNVQPFSPYDYEYDNYTEYSQASGYDYEILLTLKSIEYHLKIVSGGMVLALISLFIWFTVLKPIRNFTRV